MVCENGDLSRGLAIGFHFLHRFAVDPVIRTEDRLSGRGHILRMLPRSLTAMESGGSDISSHPHRFRPPERCLRQAETVMTLIRCHNLCMAGRRTSDTPRSCRRRGSDWSLRLEDRSDIPLAHLPSFIIWGIVMAAAFAAAQSEGPQAETTHRKSRQLREPPSRRSSAAAELRPFSRSIGKDTSSNACRNPWPDAVAGFYPSGPAE